MAIIVQDSSNNWYYYSLSSKGLTTAEIPNSAFENSNTLNEAIPYWGTYDMATYVTADTSEAYNFFSEAGKNSSYNPVTNNCSQFVIDGLKKSTLYDGTNMEVYIGKINSMLPKSAMKVLSDRFYNNSWNYKSYRKTINDQIWETTEGETSKTLWGPILTNDLKKLYY